MSNLDRELWVFGYGSLIFKTDFPFRERQVASIRGWERRFWQGSNDHRGTPDRPGRVITLIPAASSTIRGMAYRIDNDVFTHLDNREKNGYARHQTTMLLEQENRAVVGTVYVADENNQAFLGPASINALVRQIATSHGPSGSNSDYALQLARALKSLGETDEHVELVERELLNLITADSGYHASDDSV